MPENNNRDVIQEGQCRYVLFTARSSKGNSYTALKVIVNGYEFPKPLFINGIERELFISKTEKK